MDKQQTPRAFYKDRYPEMFSDSLATRNAELDESFFEYYLETITSRSQEKNFEYFCRALAEKEICPNLITQTGPTGGGDSKVDSETYPVADSLSLTWYSGLGREAASERWAFAFSAKKDWRSKVAADVASIISTDRGYAKIFFFSNQFISDKKRAQAEDNLKEKYNIDIRIFDRAWIVEKVFSKNYKKLAIEKLGLSENFKDEMKIGPLDYKRQQKLDEIEQYIQDNIASDMPSAVVEPALNAAIIMRELERPNAETNARFDRALDLAQKYGTDKQEKDCVYQWAWTLYWWHEDFQAFHQKYCLLEDAILVNPCLKDLEHLSNLLLNLYRISADTDNNSNEYCFQEHLDKFREYYNQITDNESKPNTTLQARAIYIPIRLITGENINDLTEELIDILKSAETSFTFDFELQKRMIVEIPVYQYAKKYDELFELVVKSSENRKQELEAAKLLIIRAQQLEDEKPYSAIKYLGRALVKLIKEESKNDLANVLFHIGALFDRVGLKWAAHGYYLNCFQIGMQHYFDYGEVFPNLLGALDGLKSFEMLNGRVIHAAEFYFFEKATQNIFLTLNPDSNLKSILNQEEIDIFDMVLGIQIFRTSFEELPSLEYVPDYLEERGLMNSSMALKYMLGHIDSDLLAALGNGEAVEEYVNNWYNQPARGQLLNMPWYGSSTHYTLVSQIMGCIVTYKAENTFPCIEAAESIAAASEAFMGTGIADRMYSTITPEITININLSEEKGFTVQPSISSGKHVLNVFCEPYPESADIAYQMKIKEFILNIVIHIVSRMVRFETATQTTLEDMIKNDNLFDRAITFTNSIQIITNYFHAHTPSIDYEVDKATRYPCIRTVQVSFRENKIDFPENLVEDDIIVKEYKVLSSSSSEQPSFEDIKQSEIVTIPTINMQLWDEAEWRGAAFLSDRVTKLSFSPVFENVDAGIEIFKEWIETVGNEDHENYVKIAIIKGIDQDNSTYYRVVFSANPELSIHKGNKIVTTLCRSHTMEAKSDDNIKMFEEMYSRLKTFDIFPSGILNGQVKFHTEYAIRKTEIEICDAWTIEDSSFLSAAIFPFDNPVIPQGIQNAPVLKVINRKRTSNS